MMSSFCECGHPISDHADRKGMCEFTWGFGDEPVCLCDRYEWAGDE